MYTQCSKCETVFKLSAEVLRAAGGQVRCGKCGEVFSALANLAEDTSAFAAGESPLELETRADGILETVVPPQVAQAVAEDYEDFAPIGVEIARLEVLDPDRSMEFTLPPGELDRIFVESKQHALPPEPPEPLEPSEPPTQSTPPTPPTPTAQSATSTPSTPTAQSAPPTPPTPSTQSAPPTPVAPSTQSAPPTQPAAPEQPLPHPESEQLSGFDVPDDVRRDMIEGYELHREPARMLRDAARRDHARRRALILWTSAAIIAALLLLAQVLQQNPEGFATVLGTRQPQRTNLSAYQLRQWGVTGDPDANGALRVRASILNTTPQLQPYPLLRVTLADRFGKSIGTRDFEPGEYLGKPTARLLAPGERADATLAILDPGKSAEGFEIDVCLRGADQRIACAGDAAPQAAR